MHRQIIAAAAASLLLLLTLGGCGSDTKSTARSADETKAIGSLTTKIGSGGKDSSTEFFGPDFPKCFAEKLVDEAGLDQLVKDKVLNADNEAAEDFDSIDHVSEESAQAFADAEYDCIDWDQVSTYLKDHNDEAKIDEAQIDDYVACMNEIDGDVWKAASKDQAMGEDDTDAITEFGDATTVCQEKISS
jgi:hypothetical protein